MFTKYQFIGVRLQKVNCIFILASAIVKTYISFFNLKGVSIVSMLLIFMMKKCVQEAMITKTLETLDRVNGGRGVLLL